MKVKISLDFGTKKEEHEVEIRDGLKGIRLLNAIDRAVIKKFKDTSWEAWSLIDIVKETKA